MARLALDSRTRLLLTPIGRSVLTARGPAAELLRRSLARRLDAAERAWTERIEQRRSELEVDARVVAFEELGSARRREIGELCRTASASATWAQLLFRLVRAVRPERCLELGTCLGISACYQGAALRLNGEGRLITIEGRPEVAAIAGETIAQLDLGAEIESRVDWFEDGLGRALADLERLDYGFVDGHHDGGATLEYFAQIRARLSSGAILVVDDIDWSAGMREAWDAIAGDSATAGAVDLGRLGVWICR